MPRKSAGILLFRFNKKLEVLLVHPGGPFWARKDIGVWSIPKGEFSDDEEPFAAAQREFEEEIGTSVSGNFIPLTPIKQKAGKIIHGWALEGDIDTQQIVSNTFEMEWPPKSGKIQHFPEIDKAEWFSIADAKEKINPNQTLLLDELLTKLG